MVTRSFNIFAIFVALTGAAAAQDAVASTAIANALDMTSFNNSIGPRRVDGLKTLEDYGFTHFETEGGTVYFVSSDPAWLMVVDVIGRKGDTVTFCIGDHAQAGGTYHTLTPLQAELGKDGLYHATAIEPALPECHL